MWPSSTSSSSPGPYALLARMALFAAMVFALAQSFRLWGFNYPSWPGPHREGDTLYLAYDDFFYDHVKFLFSETGPIEQVRASSLLFMGNSRLMLGVQRESVRQSLGADPIRPYWFGFGIGENWTIPARILRERDLAPRLLVVNTDEQYFSEGMSFLSRYLLDLGPDRAQALAKRKMLRNTRWRALMRVFPVPQWIPAKHTLEFTRIPYVYRSVNEGDWVLADPALTEKQRQPIAKPAPRPLPKDYTIQLANARSLLQLVRERGGEMVLIVVPQHDHDDSVALALGRDLGISVMKDPDWSRYATYDTSHLNTPSAAAFTRKMMAQLRNTPEWQKVSSVTSRSQALDTPAWGEPKP